ncbi:MAG: VWA domain-containing protein [Anaerolineales bacterium]|nr:VWA domain-containing protein [Anaerolineales bacterium]
MTANKYLRFILTFILLSFIGLQPFSQVAAQADDAQVRITQVDNSQFPNVTVYVSVTNASGAPVGVDPETIQIHENGELMQPVNVQGGGAVVGGEAIPVTTILVIDISGSMDKNDKIGAAKEAAKAYVSGMRAGDQAGLITYDTQVYTVQPITTDIPTLISAIDGLQTGSDTAMYNALIEAEKALESVSGRKAIIVLTDGMDNQSSSTAEDVINSIGESGLSISAIGFGDITASGQEGLDEAGLRALAEGAGGQYAFATDAQTLSTLYRQYGQSLQSEYAITYISPSPLRDGINRDLTVSLSEIGVSMEAEYNPGGVLPEVSGRSWLLFGSILAAILVLLVVPGLFSRTAQVFASSKPSKSKSRIKLDKPPAGHKEPGVRFK